jgi:hypothetical protein
MYTRKECIQQFYTDISGIVSNLENEIESLKTELSYKDDIIRNLRYQNQTSRKLFIVEILHMTWLQVSLHQVHSSKC